MTKVLVVLAVVVAVTGVVVAATAPPVSFGFFAAAPVDGPSSVALPLVLGGQGLVGAVLVVLGLVVAGVALGTRLGRRRPR